MITISKDESLAVRAKFGDDAKITITNKNKRGNRKRYYMAEEPRLIRFIEQLRRSQNKPRTR